MQCTRRFRVHKAAEQIADMGYSWDSANAAASNANGDFDAAMALLLDGAVHAGMGRHAMHEVALLADCWLPWLPGSKLVSRLMALLPGLMTASIAHARSRSFFEVILASLHVLMWYAYVHGHV